MANKPTFSIIKRIDQYLLKNFPVTWSSRIHSAGIYAIGFSLLTALLCFIAPNDPRNNTTIYYWIVLMSILSLLGFIFWMIYLLRFNVFKRFGKWSSMDTLKSFIFYFIITLIIISWSFIPPVIESVRANMKYTSEELATDINSMNIKICQLEQDSISKRFKRDTFEVNNYVQRFEKRSNTYNDNAPGIVDVSEIDNYYFIDTATLRTRLSEADSVKRISDSLYVIYDCPDYTFINNYSVDDHSKVKLLSDMDLYRQVLQNRQNIDIPKLRTELGQLFRKYSTDHDPVTLSAGYDSYNNYGENSYMSKINDKYDLYQINNRVENIADKKYRWDGELVEISWRLLYYFTLCLSVLVLIYRHTTRRTFFLSLLSAVVLTILTSIFIAMGHNGNDKSFYIWTIAYFILFAILTAFIFYSRNRNVVSGIGLNLLVFMTPFMPLVITGLYYKSLQDSFRYPYDSVEHAIAFKNEEYHFLLAEIGGGILLILLLATLYQMAYKKWFSLPEQ
jgi:hypothetical protein